MTKPQETKIGELQQKVSGLESKVTELSGRLGSGLSRLEAFDKHATEEHLDELESTARMARKRSQAELQKNIVLSEVGRYLAIEKPEQFSSLFLCLMEDMDRDIEWWSGSHWTIGEWAGHLIKSAIKRKDNEAA